MQRITVTVDDDLKAQFDAFMQEHGYGNRSEAIRDLLRERIERERFETTSAASCVGCLTYVYGHDQRELPRRLVQAQHAHHDLNVSTLHLHLDHDTCLEAVVLRGPTAAVTDFARGVITQRGIRHGHLWMVPVSLEMKRHSHDAGEAPAPPHVHSRPTT
jgi:CopG family transcriptional regulator, nickel-responsive regulator